MLAQVFDLPPSIVDALQECMSIEQEDIVVDFYTKCLHTQEIVSSDTLRPVLRMLLYFTEYSPKITAAAFLIILRILDTDACHEVAQLFREDIEKSITHNIYSQNVNDAREAQAFLQEHFETGKKWYTKTKNTV